MLCQVLLYRIVIQSYTHTHIYIHIHMCIYTHTHRHILFLILSSIMFYPEIGHSSPCLSILDVIVCTLRFRTPHSQMRKVWLRQVTDTLVRSSPCGAMGSVVSWARSDADPIPSLEEWVKVVLLQLQHRSCGSDLMPGPGTPYAVGWPKK